MTRPVLLALKRLVRRAISEPPVTENNYKSRWNYYALDNARDWIFTGATDDSFESSGQHDADRILARAPGARKVLNIGCGIGRVEKHLAPHVAELWGVDISGEMIAQAKHRLAEFSNVHLRELELGEFLSTFSAGSFDLVFSLLVLQHMDREDAFLYLQDAHRVLRPGGTLFVQFPNLLSSEYTEAFLDPIRRGDRSASRVRPYTVDEVRHLMSILQFEIQDLSVEAGRDGNAEIYITAGKAPAAR